MKSYIPKHNLQNWDFAGVHSIVFDLPGQEKGQDLTPVAPPTVAELFLKTGFLNFAFAFETHFFRIALFGKELFIVCSI